MLKIRCDKTELKATVMPRTCLYCDTLSWGDASSKRHYRGHCVVYEVSEINVIYSSPLEIL